MRFERGVHPRRIAQLLGCSPKTIYLVVQQSRTLAEREAAVLVHRRKVHLNFQQSGT
jgi:hypothetical protein